MIEINLLPEELRKKKSPFGKIDLSGVDLKSIPLVPIASAAVAVLIGVEAIVLGLNLYYKMRVGSLTKKYESVLPGKREADELKARRDAINKKLGAIDDLMGKRFSWAKKLNDLSDAVTPGIWLSELDYNEQAMPDASSPQGRPAGIPGMLVLSGYAAGAGEQGAALVGKFIKSLKDNGAFFSDFSDVALVAVKSDKVDNQEVMSFRINCVFK